MGRVIENVATWAMWRLWCFLHPYDVMAARRYARRMEALARRPREARRGEQR